MNYLPKSVGQLNYLYLPYTEIIAKYPYLENDKIFWLQKAALEVGKNWQDKEFREFFDRQDLSNTKKYLRVLAYDGIALPGSEFILSVSEMFRHGLKDPELLKYCWSLLNEETQMTVLKEILSIFLRSGRVSEINHPIFKYVGTTINDLEQFFILSDIEYLENVAQKSVNDNVAYYTEEYLKQTKEYEEGIVGPEIYTAVLVHAALRGKEVTDPEVKLLKDIITQNLEGLREDIILDYNLELGLISHIDNPEMIKILIDKIPKTHRVEFIFNNIMRSVYYGSNIFTYLMEHYSQYLSQMQISSNFKYMLQDKAISDFAGLATIFTYLSKTSRDEIISLPMSQFRQLHTFVK